MVAELVNCSISDDLRKRGLASHTKSTVECGHDAGPFHLHYILFVY